MTFRIGIISDTHGLPQAGGGASPGWRRSHHSWRGHRTSRNHRCVASHRSGYRDPRKRVDIDDWACCIPQRADRGRATCGKSDLRSARSEGSGDRSDRARHRRRRVGSFPCAEDRNKPTAASLPESRKRGAAPPSGCPSHLRRSMMHAGQPAAGNPRSQRHMKRPRGCVGLKRWQVEMGTRREGPAWIRFPGETSPPCVAIAMTPALIAAGDQHMPPKAKSERSKSRSGPRHGSLERHRGAG